MAAAPCSAAPPPPDLARCAFVSLVMRGDAYVPGALVCAHSLRLAGTRARLVCMVTACVSALARRRLRCVWDEVVEVPALRFECRKLVSVKQRRMYEQWVETSFTKWNCLALTQYAKVVFIDADKVVLANCDELFSLRAPAGTFSSPWAWPFNTKGEGIPNPYALSCAQHGDAVPPEACVGV